MKDKNKTNLHLVDDMSPQELMGTLHQMPHLAQEDAKIEWLAWLVVLGLFATVIMQTG